MTPPILVSTATWLRKKNPAAYFALATMLVTHSKSNAAKRSDLVDLRNQVELGDDELDLLYGAGPDDGGSGEEEGWESESDGEAKELTYRDFFGGSAAAGPLHLL